MILCKICKQYYEVKDIKNGKCKFCILGGKRICIYCKKKDKFFKHWKHNVCHTCLEQNIFLCAVCGNIYIPVQKENGSLSRPFIGGTRSRRCYKCYYRGWAHSKKRMNKFREKYKFKIEEKIRKEKCLD